MHPGLPSSKTTEGLLDQTSHTDASMGAQAQTLSLRRRMIDCIRHLCPAQHNLGTRAMLASTHWLISTQALIQRNSVYEIELVCFLQQS